MNIMHKIKNIVLKYSKLIPLILYPFAYLFFSDLHNSNVSLSVFWQRRIFNRIIIIMYWPMLLSAKNMTCQRLKELSPYRQTTIILDWRLT